jgi:threonine synthase
MNVGHPSNVARLIAMYGGVMDEKGVIHQPADLEKIRREMYAVSVTDAQTEETIRSAWRDHELVLEPHGAVAWAGLTRHLDTHAEDRDRLCVSIETAHPAKFPEKIRELLGFDPELPPSLQNLDDKEEFVSPLENDYPAFKTCRRSIRNENHHHSRRRHGGPPHRKTGEQDDPAGGPQAPH